MSPEADDGHLLGQPLLVLREVHGEEAAERRSRQLSRHPTEDAEEGGWRELDLEEGGSCETRQDPDARLTVKLRSPDRRPPESGAPPETCRSSHRRDKQPQLRAQQASGLPLQRQLHPGDQREGDQVLHQRLLLLQAADGAAASQLQVGPARSRSSLQLLHRLRLGYLDTSSSSVRPSVRPHRGEGVSDLVDMAGEVGAGGHVADSQRLVGRVVEETLVESRREEADGGTPVDQAERQQAAHVVVQVVTQG